MSVLSPLGQKLGTTRVLVATGTLTARFGRELFLTDHWLRVTVQVQCGVYNATIPTVSERSRNQSRNRNGSQPGASFEARGHVWNRPRSKNAPGCFKYVHLSIICYSAHPRSTFLVAHTSTLANPCSIGALLPPGSTQLNVLAACTRNFACRPRSCPVRVRSLST